MKKAFLNWSSGKDAAFALYKLQQQRDLSLQKLVTTVNSELNRISMHGLREQLLLQQAKSLGLPLHIIPLKGNVSMETYNRSMAAATEALVAEGYTHSIFGDIFLEDLREYREKQLARVGLQGVFPLWKSDTSILMQEFLESGFKAITVCVNAKLLDDSFCGRIVDEQFLRDLPAGVDPCGENGEFHTFVFDGPNFQFPIDFELGEKVLRTYEPEKKEGDNCFKDEQEPWDTGFWYCDLIERSRV